MMRKAAFCCVFGLSLACVALVVATGCDWQAVGSDDSWTDVPGMADSTGVYTPISGDYLVAKQNTGSTLSQSSVSFTISEESIGTGDGTDRIYSGNLHDQPVPGTVTVSDGFDLLTEVVSASGGSAGETALIGQRTFSGTTNRSVGGVNPVSRKVWADFYAPVEIGKQITVSYVPLSADEASQQNTEYGSSYPITQFLVRQQGDNIEIVDNNGDVYVGKVGMPSMDPNGRSSSNAVSSAPVFPFEAHGSSHDIPVTISGVMSVEQIEYWSRTWGADGYTMKLVTTVYSYTMRGTWIEESTGKRGTVAGVGMSDKTVEDFDRKWMKDMNNGTNGAYPYGYGGYPYYYNYYYDYYPYYWY